MKRFVILFFSFLIFQNAYSQSSDWKVIATPESSNLNVLYQTGKGHLIGKFSEINEYYITKNNAQSWEKLTLPEDLVNAYSFEFREDTLGNVYAFDDFSNFIYQMQQDNSFKVFVEIDLFESVEDFKFLPNGNYLIATDYWLKLYNAAGKELSSHDWDIYWPILLPSQTKDSSLYVIVSDLDDELIEFDKDLNVLSTTVLSESYFGDAQRNGNRIFMDNLYSDNKGETWTEMPSVSWFSEIVVGKDGRLYSLNDKNILISNNNGNSFTTKSIPFYADELFANKVGQLVIGGEDCSGGIIASSNNIGTNWEKVNSPKAIPSIYNLAATSNDNLFNRGCSNNFIKQNSTSIWKTLSIGNSSLSDFGNFYVLKNNSIITYDDFSSNLFISTNNGTTWSEKSVTQLGSMYNPFFIEKNNILYATDDFELAYSLDNGNTWNSSTIVMDIFYTYNRFSSTFNLYGFDYFDDLLYIEDLNTNKIDTVELDFVNDWYFEDFQTSFTGDTLYCLASQQGQDDYTLALFTSTDKGRTFYSNTIKENISYDSVFDKIIVDRNGYLYTYSEKGNVLYSTDKGITWKDISPTNITNTYLVNNFIVSNDNYIYLSTAGAGILKYQKQLGTATSELETLPLSFYPNPTDGILTFSQDFDQNATALVSDMLGKSVLNQSLSGKRSLDLSSLPVGVYSIQIQSENKLYVSKILKH